MRNVDYDILEIQILEMLIEEIPSLSEAVDRFKKEKHAFKNKEYEKILVNKYRIK